jgi:hypothetical protein
LSNTLKDDYGVHGNIASNSEWMDTLTVSYYLNGKYYGMPRETNSSTDLQQELEDYKIDFYIVYNDTADLNLSDYHEITNGKIVGLKIYTNK